MVLRRRRRKRRLRLSRTLGVVLLLGVVAYGVASRLDSPRIRPGHQSSSRRKTSKGKAVSTVAAKRPAPGAGDLFTVPAVADYLAGVTGDDVTAAVYDARTGYTSLFRPGIAEDTASIMKVDILATLLAQAQANATPLTSEQQELAEDMIEESDDNDAQDLWDGEGGATAVASFDAQVGLTNTDPDAAGYWGLSTTTAADQVKLLEKVAYPNALLTDASRAYELDLMSNVDPAQAWGVSAGAPPGVTVALKNGWLPLDSGGWQINSIGYIDGDGRDYVIAVLTSGDATEGEGIQTIQGLSSLVWQELAPAS